MRKVGDKIILEGIGQFDPGIECIILEVSPDDGRITKMRAVIPDERLGQIGFILEGEDYIVMEWTYFPN